MSLYNMRLESRYADDWYSDKVVSNKRQLFGLVYYLICHLFVLPLIIMSALSTFTLLSNDEILNVFQMYSDSLSGIILIIIMWPLFIDNLERFTQKLFRTVIQGAKWYLPSILMNAAISYGILVLTGIEQSSNQLAVEALLKANFWGMFIPAVVVAPIIEELVFRGIIFRSFRKFGFLPAALVSGLFFGLLHCIGDITSGNWIGLIYVLVYMSMGMFMCKAYEDSKNLFGAVFLHFLNNFLSVLIILMV
ncbi:MAG: CPBP family intramembrane metalloprotease [Erysipelotrichales bacterium]|nr:CPBP family intramembrane metalloprotease [Erysipelotrichales bacterium]